MSYLLEDHDEFYRLEKQAKQQHYSLDEEFRHLNLSQNAYILDAGCGSGLVSRYLTKKESTVKIQAVDYSDIRVAQAKKNNPVEFDNITFSRADLNELPFADNTFDFVVSRFVYEYLPDPVKTTKELRRVLKPGGKIYLVDLDGVFLNFWTDNEKFNNDLTSFSNKIDIDLFVGRKLSSFIKSAGLKKTNWDITVHKFKDSINIQQEKENNIDRFKFAEESFRKYFPSSEDYNCFVQTYIKSMDDFESNTLFFNKFCAWGEK